MEGDDSGGISLHLRLDIIASVVWGKVALWASCSYNVRSYKHYHPEIPNLRPLISLLFLAKNHDFLYLRNFVTTRHYLFKCLP